MNHPSVNSAIDLTVLFCTRNRAQSLKETINCVLAGDRSSIAVELVIIDNGGKDETRQVAESFSAQVPVRYYLETKEGKGHCLNRALDEGGLGRIVACLDDDMSPQGNWINDVIAACTRLPDVDLFGGHVYIIWPPGPVPEWAMHCRSDVRGWALSAMGRKNVPASDIPLRSDRWGCGNHFWFRSKLLTSSSRFGNLWVPEPGLFLDHMGKGSKGVVCTGVVAGHRVQPHLLEEPGVRLRAAMIGRTFAHIFLRPYRPTVKAARYFNQRPLVTRLVVLAKLGVYAGLYSLSLICGSRNLWFERQIHAIERMSYHRELLRIAFADKAYSLWPGAKPKTSGQAEDVGS